MLRPVKESVGNSCRSVIEIDGKLGLPVKEIVVAWGRPVKESVLAFLLIYIYLRFEWESNPEDLFLPKQSGALIRWATRLNLLSTRPKAGGGLVVDSWSIKLICTI